MGAQDEGRTTRIRLGPAGSLPRAPRVAARRAPVRTPPPDGGATTSVIRHDPPRSAPARTDRSGTAERIARADRPARPARPVRAESRTAGHSATRWLRYADPTSSGRPVFVDGSGRRRTFWRVVGVLVVAACLVFLAVLVVAAVAGSPGAVDGPSPTLGVVPGSAPGAGW